MLRGLKFKTSCTTLIIRLRKLIKKFILRYTSCNKKVCLRQKKDRKKKCLDSLRQLNKHYSNSLPEFENRHLRRLVWGFSFFDITILFLCSEEKSHPFWLIIEEISMQWLEENQCLESDIVILFYGVLFFGFFLQFWTSSTTERIRELSDTSNFILSFTTIYSAQTKVQSSYHGILGKKMLNMNEYLSWIHSKRFIEKMLAV